MNTLQKILLGSVLLISAGNACLASGLAPEVEAGLLNPEELAVASDDELDEIRGGFDLGSGLMVSFGIVKSVTINGDLVTQTFFNLPDLTKITPEQAKMASAAIAQAALVQNGPGNSLASSIRGQLAPGTVIQNSLDNQKIQAFTVINTSVNSLGILKAMNAQGAIKDALLGSLTNH